jgi:predicted nucleic acid-binding protein
VNAQPLVIDTNIVLDLLVFDDAAVQALKADLHQGQWDWIATDAMRIELERVLGYKQVALWLHRRCLGADHVLAGFDALVRVVPAAARAPLRCSDADDQVFIDLAVAHRATLLSKDRDVTGMCKRLALHGVRLLDKAGLTTARMN